MNFARLLLLLAIAASVMVGCAKTEEAPKDPVPSPADAGGGATQQGTEIK